MRIDVPLIELMDMIREAGIEPTPERVENLIAELQDRFADKHGGCGAHEVMEYILSTAALVVGEWGDDEHTDEGTFSG